ncbi:MAG: primosomal protein N' [Candidatus Eremiobacteraeota bacterium]|nr:primosomal protein N' [Candidatus Eremiobacteraeota bacterium]
MSASTQTRTQMFDVVIDVQTRHIDEQFTYAAREPLPAIGSRVRVSFGARTVSGWIVRRAVGPQTAREVKFIEEVLDDAPLDHGTIALAAWLRRRYACTFREALLTVAPRGSPQTLERFYFAHEPPHVDEPAQALYRRFQGKSFSSLAAGRVLSSRARRTPMEVIRRTLLRLVHDGVLQRSAAEAPQPSERLSKDSLLMLVDAAQARDAASKRLVAALADAGGSQFYAELKRGKSATAVVVKRAAASGAIRVEHHAARAPRVPTSAAPVSFTPTGEQRDAIERIDMAMRAGGGSALLHGVTGSGKTFVYSRLVDRLRSRGGQAVVLVPEIALTPQTAGRFVAAFGAKVAVLHSGLSAKERSAVWQSAERGALDVIVGARSAIFAPLPDLRLVIVDEEHETSYKQDVAPRYDAATVAIERMRQVGGTVILGSATPSLETYSKARNGEMLYVRLAQRATKAPLPAVEIVNMAEQQSYQKRRPLSPVLAAAIETALARGEKVLLFVNRRGYAGLLLCRSCGFAPRCKRCAVTLVVHSAGQSMRCHICGDAFRIPVQCPKCSSQDLRPFGFGTQRVEEEARALFPSARVVRMDSDTTGGQGAHERLLDEFGAEGDILIGTQMIAKGLDYPTVTLVGVVAADLDLNRPDFRAAERTFALLTQVAGRAGRAAPGSRVLVQTYAPDHYAIVMAATHDYESFATKELMLRRELRYPPFGRLAYLIVAGMRLEEVELQARTLANTLRERARDVLVLGPAPDSLAKARGEFRFRIALKTDDEDALLRACALAQEQRLGNDIRLAVTVDPR